mgnify:CR=1 FL=1|tara:strand:+ start:239 stop:931 length:693 start_codon:yes stop_codon:yes gene_type:complete
MKQEKLALLVSMDVLLDTRLAALNKVNPDYPAIVLANDWKNRSGDFFEQWIEDFDRELYNTHYWYRGRDGDVHTNSIMTGYMTRLIADITILREGATNHPMAGEVCVDINVWPYNLGSEEKEVFVGVIKEYVGSDIRVGIFSIAPEELTPKAIRGRWCSFSIYNFDEWLTIHSEALLDTPIPSVVCVAPRLLKKPLDEEVDMDPTLEVSGALIEFLGVEWITPKEVSLII